MCCPETRYAVQDDIEVLENWNCINLFVILNINKDFIGVCKLKLHSLFLSAKGRTQYKKQEKGFSLIELLVVMGIIGVIMALGLSAFTQFRKGRQVDTVAYAVRDMIKDARSKAMSVSTSSTDVTGVWPIGYSVVIDPSYVLAQVIHDPGGSIVYVPWTTWVGAVIDTYSSSEVSPVEVTLTECNKVVFESVNGTMHVYNGELPLSADTLCTIRFSLPGYFRELQLRADEKVFEIL